MSEPLIGQCPYCDGNLTNGHKCRQMLETVAGIGLGSRLSVATSTDAYSPRQRQYIDSGGGAAHQSAVVIIGNLERELAAKEAELAGMYIANRT